MQKGRITNAIKEILDAEYGFEIYVVMKNGNQIMEKFVLNEGKPNNGYGFKTRIRDSIENTVRTKYLSDDSQYASGDFLANDQNRFFVITQDDDYHPFAYLSMPETQLECFRLEDKENADALLFKFIFQRKGRVKQFWAYQKILPSSIPNKKKQHFQLTPKSEEHPDIFIELTNQMFIITQKVNLLVLPSETESNEVALGEIITGDIKLMERHLGLESFVRASAKRAAAAITTVGLVKNVNKLQEYVQRPNKKYAKKMMQIHRYPVSTMSKDSLVDKLHTVERWKGVFDIQEEQVNLRNFTDVESLIDLFTERYTKSEVTGQEYDTEVKDKAEPRTITQV